MLAVCDNCCQICAWGCLFGTTVMQIVVLVCAFWRPADNVLHAQMHTEGKHPARDATFPSWQAILVVVVHHDTQGRFRVCSRECWCCWHVNVPTKMASACVQVLAAPLQERFRRQVSRPWVLTGCRNDGCAQFCQRVDFRHRRRHHAPDTQIQG